MYFKNIKPCIRDVARITSSLKKLCTGTKHSNTIRSQESLPHPAALSSSPAGFISGCKCARKTYIALSYLWYTSLAPGKSSVNGGIVYLEIRKMWPGFWQKETTGTSVDYTPMSHAGAEHGQSVTKIQADSCTLFCTCFVSFLSFFFNSGTI